MSPEIVTNNHWEFKTVITDRLCINSASMDDVQDIYSSYGDHTSDYFEINLKWTLEEEQECTQWRIEAEKHKTWLLLIARDHNKELVWVGWFDNLDTMTPSIGLWLNHKYTGRWYWYEFTKNMVDWCFTHLPNTLYIIYECFENNTSSVKLAEKLWGILKDKNEKTSWKSNKNSNLIYHIYTSH